jgi:hypothetical protein
MRRDLLELEQQIARDAERIRDDLLGSYFAAEYERILTSMRGVRGQDEAMMTVARLRAVDDLKAHLDSLIDTGKLAAHQLDNAQ